MLLFLFGFCFFQWSLLFFFEPVLQSSLKVFWWVWFRDLLGTVAWGLMETLASHHFTSAYREARSQQWLSGKWPLQRQNKKLAQSSGLTQDVRPKVCKVYKIDDLANTNFPVQIWVASMGWNDMDTMLEFCLFCFFLLASIKYQHRFRKQLMFLYRHSSSKTSHLNAKTSWSLACRPRRIQPLCLWAVMNMHYDFH